MGLRYRGKDKGDARRGKMSKRHTSISAMMKYHNHESITIDITFAWHCVW